MGGGRNGHDREFLWQGGRSCRWLYKVRGLGLQVLVQVSRAARNWSSGGEAKVYHQRSSASVNVLVNGSGEGSLRQAGSRLDG